MSAKFPSGGGGEQDLFLARSLIPLVIIALYQTDVQSGKKRLPFFMVKFYGKMHNKRILRTYYTYHLFYLIKNIDDDQI